MTYLSLARLRFHLVAATLQMRADSLNSLIEKYSPSQPRIPAGVPEGGQWTQIDGISVAGKWNERNRAKCEAQYESDISNAPWNPFCESQAMSRMTACMKGDPIQPFFHIGDAR